MVNLVLRAYSLGTIKTCDYVHRRISAETYYEVCLTSQCRSIHALTCADSIQEEDFVTNLYHRSLLTTFESTGIESLLTEAAIWLERSETSDGLRKALSYRLESRKALLKAVALDMDVCNEGSNPHWKKCDMIINQLLETKALGHAADGAFSAKTQRRLASTVPPRPMVNINLEDACAHLHRMCTDGEEMLRILDYQGSNNLLVRIAGALLSPHSDADFTDICIDFPSSTATAFCLQSMSTTITRVQRNEGSGQNIDQATHFG